MTNIKNKILYNKNFRQNKIHYDFKYRYHAVDHYKLAIVDELILQGFVTGSCYTGRQQN